MLQNFRFARYRLTYTVQEPLTMPAYKGNIFRGRFGYILRHVACIGRDGQCEKQCEFPDQCVYSKCFETPVPKDSPVLRGQTFAPHPFVLEPPRTGTRTYVPGDTFSHNLILIGEAIEVLPWLIFAFYRMAEQRIGLKNELGRCELTKVESLPADDSEPSQTIYTAETEMLSDEGIVLHLDDVIAAAPHLTDQLHLEFLTPTSIKVNGKWTSQLTFETFIRNLLRRLRFLNYFHCGEDLDTEVDARGLIEMAGAVTHESRLLWLQRGRYSHREKAVVPMSGFMGPIHFEGDMTPFLPFIYLGEYLHIGHHTAFGYGQYRIGREHQ